MAESSSQRLVYTPAELGFNSVAIAFGVTIAGNWLEWRKAFDFDAFTLFFEEIDGAGATPFTIGIATRDFDGAAWVNSETAESMITGVTNNPRAQFLRMSHDGHGNAVGVGTTGTFISGAVGRAFISPQVRFSVTNTHASINGTVRMRAALELRG